MIETLVDNLITAALKESEAACLLRMLPSGKHAAAVKAAQRKTRQARRSLLLVAKGKAR